MSIIIDANCFANVFKETSKNHLQFKPVLDWIDSGKGTIVYGGTKYIEELGRGKYSRIMNLYKRQNKVQVANKDRVDQEENRIKNLIRDANFNDPHLAAISIVCHCRIICSNDISSINFVCNKTLYPKKFKIPRYYTCAKNADLLCDKNIDKRYKKKK